MVTIGRALPAPAYGAVEGDGVGDGLAPGAGLPDGAAGLPDGAGVGEGVGSGGQPWMPRVRLTTRGVAAPPRASMLRVSWSGAHTSSFAPICG